MASRLRLHHRIVIPFAIVALVATAGAALAALSSIARTLDGRAQAQVASTATVLSQSDFALNPYILESLKRMTGADVITFTRGGELVLTTLNRDTRRDLIARIMAPEHTRRLDGAQPDSAVIENVNCGAPCVVAYRSVPSQPDIVVALVVETSEVTAATRAVTRTILLASGLSVLVMIVVGQILARRLTAPLDELLRFTREEGASPDGAGALPSVRRARAGDDEIGRLARAFNEMLDRLARSREALVRSEKLAVTGLLAARVAHDIRSPLSSIKMLTQLLAAQLPDNRDQRALVTTLLEDIDLVEGIIRDLLELAKPGALRREPTPLEEVVTETLRQFQARLDHRKISTTTEFGPALPAVAIDRARFKRALSNVIVNAADAMPTGGTLGVRTTLGPQGSTVVLEVTDDGSGVDPEIRDRVFDAFVSTKPDGVGLGLVNTKAIVDSHGGRISLTPRLPRGTCVTIELPVT